MVTSSLKLKKKPKKHQNNFQLSKTPSILHDSFIVEFTTSLPRQPVKPPPSHQKIKLKQLHCLLILRVSLLNREILSFDL